MLYRTKPPHQQAVWLGLAPYLFILAVWGWSPDYRSSVVDQNRCFAIPVSSWKTVKHISAKQMLAHMQARGEGRILKHVTQLLFSKQTHTEANVTQYYPIIRAGIKSSHTHWFSVFTTPIKPSGVLFWVFITNGIIKSLSLCVAPLLKLKQNAENLTRCNSLAWGLFPVSIKTTTKTASVVCYYGATEHWLWYAEGMQSHQCDLSDGR